MTHDIHEWEHLPFPKSLRDLKPDKHVTYNGSLRRKLCHA